jgi:hypothetical protein
LTRHRQPGLQSGRGVRLRSSLRNGCRGGAKCIAGDRRGFGLRYRRQSLLPSNRRLGSPPACSIPVPKRRASSLHPPAPLPRVRVGMWAAAGEQTRTSAAPAHARPGQGPEGDASAPSTAEMGSLSLAYACGRNHGARDEPHCVWAFTAQCVPLAYPGSGRLPMG